MAWSKTGSRRTTTPEHRARRLRILERDHHVCHVCHLGGANDCDHVIPLAEGGADTDANCAAIHAHPCHATKSAREGARARHRVTTNRPAEPHPGILVERPTEHGYPGSVH